MRTIEQKNTSAHSSQTKQSRIWARYGVLGILCAVLAAGSIACGGSPTPNNNNNQGGLCGAATCPKGQFCYNGLCVVGCNVDGECASNQYCDTDFKQCANKTTPTCPSTPCGDGQTCEKGFCSAKATAPPAQKEDSGACKLAADGNDGCQKNELCIEPEENKRQCRSFPRCSADGTCPTGLAGAVCNNGLIPNKDKICLVGLCKDKANCPSDWSCVKFSGSVLGLCSSGTLGQPCAGKDDCKEGFSCQQAGGVGFCLSGGFPNPLPDLP